MFDSVPVVTFHQRESRRGGGESEARVKHEGEVMKGNLKMVARGVGSNVQISPDSHRGCSFLLE